jgi:hypothetical protein
LPTLTVNQETDDTSDAEGAASLYVAPSIT